MKKIVLYCLCSLFVCCFGLSAQNRAFTTVTLTDGTSLKAQVEKQTYGGYKLTTEDGAVFFFNENEIKSVGQIKPSNQKLEYWKLKRMYSVEGYQLDVDDKYNPSTIGLFSFLVPGLGHYITDTNIGIGVLQSALGLSALGATIECLAGVIWGGGDYYLEMLGIHSPIWLGTAIWSACSASKAAKIKNLYYRDVRNGVAYKFDVTPYFDLSSPMLASNTGIVSGLSLKISF